MISFNEQHCDSKAFKRLATRLKQAFPRLPTLILVAGLYPYEGFFATSKAHYWRYIVTFKEGNLTTVWETAIKLRDIQRIYRMPLRYETHQSRHMPEYLSDILSWCFVARESVAIDLMKESK